MTGRVPSGQALVASDEARSELHPPGFDPSRRSMIETIPEFRDVIGRTLTAMDETNIPERYIPFRLIAERSELPIERVKAVVRLLANLGYAAFARGLMSEDGEMRGAGYALTSKGFALIDRIEAIAMEARQGGDGTAPSGTDDSAGPKDIAHE